MTSRNCFPRSVRRFRRRCCATSSACSGLRVLSGLSGSNRAALSPGLYVVAMAMTVELFDLGCAFNEPAMAWSGGLCARPVQVMS